MQLPLRWGSLNKKDLESVGADPKAPAENEESGKRTESMELLPSGVQSLDFSPQSSLPLLSWSWLGSAASQGR